MRKDILPHFTNINWLVMSRIYDPNDKQFVKQFKHLINEEFGMMVEGRRWGDEQGKTAREAHKSRIPQNDHDVITLLTPHDNHL